jgi:hypothetical protein
MMDMRSTASKNQQMKEGFIRRSVDMLAIELSEEERRKLLALDRKTREKYLYTAMAEGLKAKKHKGARENAVKTETF